MDEQKLKDMSEKVNDLHAVLIGTELVPGAIPRVLSSQEDNRKRIERLERDRSIAYGALVVIYVFAGEILKKIGFWL